MDKRIERALLPLYNKAVIKPRLDEVATQLAFAAFFTLLEKQAIVIPVEVAHAFYPRKRTDIEKEKVTKIYNDRKSGRAIIGCVLGEHHGTPGKAITIILPDSAGNEDSRTDSVEEEDG